MPIPGIVALLLILGVGAALRFHRLGAESLWLDEAVSLEISQEPLAGIVHDATDDVHPPLYYFALHYWMLPFGHSEPALRSLSALLGVLVIGAVYRLGTRLFDPVTGLVAAFLVALSTLHVSLAQEARMYTLLALLSVLSMESFARLAEPHAIRRWGVAQYVAATTATLYTHNYGWFILTAQGLYLAGLAIASRDTYLQVWRRTLFAQAAVVLLYLPWLERLFEQLLRVHQGFWIPPESALSLVKTFVQYAGSLELAWALLPLALLPVVLSHERRQTGLLVVWIASLVLLPFLISRVSSPIFLPKYTIAGSVAVLVLAARGVTMLPTKVLPFAAVVAVAGLAFAPLASYYGTLHKERWRDLVAGVDSRAQSGDLVLCNPAYLQTPFDYYTKRPDLVEVPFLEVRDGLTTRSIRTLVRVAAAGHDRVWLVATTADPLTPIMLEELLARYAMVTRESDRGVETDLLVRNTSGR
jgi:mannosyltransferase